MKPSLPRTTMVHYRLPAKERAECKPFVKFLNVPTGTEPALFKSKIINSFVCTIDRIFNINKKSQITVGYMS